MERICSPRVMIGLFLPEKEIKRLSSVRLAITVRAGENKKNLLHLFSDCLNWSLYP